MATLNFTDAEHNTLLDMLVEMVTGEQKPAEVNTREFLTELLSNEESENDLRNVPAEERALVEQMTGMSIEDMLAEIEARKALVSKILSA